MKVLAIAAAYLLLPTRSFGECFVITGLHVTLTTFQSSSRRIQITALQEGKALGNVRLLFYLTTDDVAPKLALTTDKQGRVLAPNLAPGHYRILAIGPENEFAEVYLEVSDNGGAQTSSFLMAIPPTFLPEKASDIDAAPITQHLREFKGRVVDPNGAFLPEALVQVYRKDSLAEPVAKIKADNEGLFAASLAPGVYVAFISSQGFFKKIVGFEISPSGGTNDLRVELRIAFC